MFENRFIIYDIEYDDSGEYYDNKSYLKYFCILHDVLHDWEL